MPDKIVKVKYEVDLSQLEKLRKTQNAYRLEMQKTAAQTRLLLSASKQISQGFQQQTQAAAQATSQLGQAASAAQGAAQATQQNTQAAQQQAQAIAELNTKIAELTNRINKLEGAQKKSTSAAKKSSNAWLKGAKTLAFYAVGAASVFRLVQKLKQAFIETVEVLVKNTDESRRLKAAQDQLKVSFVGVIGDAEDWREIVNSIAAGIELFAEGIVQTGALVKAFGALNIRIFNDIFNVISGVAQANVLLNIGQFGAAAATMDKALGSLTTTGEGAATWLDVYNDSIEQSARAQEQFARATAGPNRALAAMRDFLKAAQEATEDLGSAQDKLADIQKRRLEELADLERERLRRLQDINTEFQRDLADLAVKGARKRQDIEIAFRRRIEDIERKRNEQRTRIEEALRLKLLRIELRFREQMTRIAENFDDAIFDAIQKRDATAALMAIRRRRRDEGRARRERDNSITLAQAEAQAKRNQQARALENQRQDAILARQRALEDLARDLAREREDIQKNYDRELDDLDTFLEQRRDDINLDFARQIARAAAHYREAEAQYRDHLNTQFLILQNHLARTNQEVSKTTTTPFIKPAVKTGIPDPATYGFARGGDMMFTKPTTIRVAERGAERVVAQPVTPGAGGGTFSGTMRHQISGSIDAAMAGFEGRMGNVITQSVISVMGEMLQ